MQLILLERVAKLGQMGDIVKVRDGFGRNFLLPQGKALRATKANLEQFATDRVHLEARNLERKSEAESVAVKMDGLAMIMVRQAGETGQLYGSVSTRDITDDLAEKGFSITRGQVDLNNPIKTIGIHRVEISLHPEVQIEITVNVARSQDEAERQTRGEDLSRRDDRFQFEEEEDEDEMEAEAEAGAEAFDAETVEPANDGDAADASESDEQR